MQRFWFFRTFNQEMNDFFNFQVKNPSSYVMPILRRLSLMQGKSNFNSFRVTCKGDKQITTTIVTNV